VGKIDVFDKIATEKQKGKMVA